MKMTNGSKRESEIFGKRERVFTGLVPRRESHPPTALAVWGIPLQRPPLPVSALIDAQRDRHGTRGEKRRD